MFEPISPDVVVSTTDLTLVALASWLSLAPSASVGVASLRSLSSPLGHHGLPAGPGISISSDVA